MIYDAEINRALDAHELMVRKAAAFDQVLASVPGVTMSFDGVRAIEDLLCAWREVEL